MTCREFGNEIRRLIRQGNLNAMTSKVYCQEAEDVSNVFPVTSVKWDGSSIVLESRQYKKPYVLWQMRNDITNLAYKHKLNFDTTQIRFGRSDILYLEANSVLDWLLIIV